MLFALPFALADEPTEDTGTTDTPESGDPAPADPPSSPPADPVANDIAAGNAIVTEDLTDKEILRFKPSRNLLPQNPRGQTDFTAYTLEWGEVELGLTHIAVGVLPGVQVSTVPAFYLPPLFSIGDEPVLSPVWNVQGKVDALRLGPVDLALQANYYTLSWPELQARFLSLGGGTSVVILPPWSVHVSGYYSMFSLDGMVSSGWLASLLGGVAGGDFSASLGSDPGDGLDLDAALDTVTLRVATDVRFNRRDSVVLQAQTLLWTSAALHSALTADGQTATVLDEELAGFVDPLQAYLLSLSYQATFRNLDLRVGIGVPFDNPAWALQAFELSWRFGGKTRLTERRTEKGFRENLGADDARP